MIELDKQTVASLERLRGAASHRLARAINEAFRRRRSAERITAIGFLVEAICHHLCDLANSLYLVPEVAVVRDLEDELLRRSANSGKLSFGDVLKGVRTLSKLLREEHLPDRIQSVWAKVFTSLDDAILDADANRYVSELAVLRQACERYKVASDRLNDYIRDQGVPPAAIGFVEAADVVHNYRNTSLHREQHLWFRSDDAFLDAVVSRLLPLTATLLLLPPVYEALTNFEMVRVGSGGHDGTEWTHSIEHGDDDVQRAGLLGSEVRSAQQLAVGEWWVYRQADGSFHALAPSRRFPSSREGHVDRLRQFQDEAVRIFLKDGAFHADNEPLLEDARKRFGVLEEAQMRAALRELRADIARLEEMIQGGAPTEAVTRVLIKVCEGRGLTVETRKRLAEALPTIDSPRSQLVYRIIADEFPISRRDLAIRSGLSDDVLDRVLERLLSENDTARRILRVRPFEGKEYFQLPAALDLAGLSATLNAIDDLQSRPPWLRPLLNATRMLLDTEQVSGLTARVTELLRTLGEASPAGAPPPPTDTPPPPPDAPPSLRVLADNTEVRGETVRELYEGVLRTWGASLAAHVPFQSGPSRYLVAREPRHPTGHDFLAPARVEGIDLVMEAHQNRPGALAALAKWLTEAGRLVSALEVDGMPLDDADEDGKGARSIAGALVITVAEPEGAIEIRGTTVPELLERVLCYVVDHRLPYEDHVPFGIGRVRRLVSRDGKHADGRPFDRPVEVGPLYAEASLERNAARYHAARFLIALGVSLAERVPSPEDDLVVTVGDFTTRGGTVAELLVDAVTKLREAGQLPDDRLPWPMGPKRYLIAKQPIHQSGSEFMSAIKCGDLFLEGRLDRLRAQQLVEDLVVRLRDDVVPEDHNNGDGK